MAVTVVQHVMSADATSGTVLAATLAASGAGNLIVVLARSVAGAASPITGVTDGTTAFTQATGSFFDDINATMDVWYLLSSNSGKTSISITWTVTNTNRRAEVWEVSGFGTCQFDGGSNLNTQTAPGFSYHGSPITTTGSKGFMVAGIFQGGGVTVFTNPTGGNEFTAGGDTAGGNAYNSAILTTAGVHVSDWTGDVGSQSYGTTAAAFKEAGSGGQLSFTGEDDGIMPYIVANEPSIISVW